MKDLRSGRLLAKGFRKGNLYFLSASVGQAHHTRVSSSSSASLRTWHLRLAHASFTTIRSLVSIGSLKVDCNSASPSHICLGCQLGKHTKLPFSPCNKRADHFFSFFYAGSCTFFFFIWFTLCCSFYCYSRYTWFFFLLETVLAPCSRSGIPKKEGERKMESSQAKLKNEFSCS